MSYLPKTEAARVHNSVFHDWGTGDSEYVRAEDCNSIEEECESLRSRVADLEKLVKLSINALRCANNGFMGSPYGQKVVDDALIALEKGGSK